MSFTLAPFRSTSQHLCLSQLLLHYFIVSLARFLPFALLSTSLSATLVLLELPSIGREGNKNTQKSCRLSLPSPSSIH